MLSNFFSLIFLPVSWIEPELLCRLLPILLFSNNNPSTPCHRCRDYCGGLRFGSDGRVDDVHGRLEAWTGCHSVKSSGTRYLESLPLVFTLVSFLTWDWGYLFAEPAIGALQVAGSLDLCRRLICLLFLMTGLARLFCLLVWELV